MFSYQKNICLLLCLMLVNCTGCSGNDPEGSGDEGGKGQGSVTLETNYLPIADPYVLTYNDKYYAYGTGGTLDGEEGIPCFSSTDLTNWKRESLALSAVNTYGSKWFWAPEVYYIEKEKKFYMFYSAEEHICVATSNSPVGPFKQTDKKPVWDEKSIDTSLFIDDDGTPYLYFVRFTGGNVIWVAEMTPDLMGIKTETLKECIRADKPWEQVLGNVAEGPSVLKKNGTYYLVYSANDYQSADYAVGYATSSSPYGPWTKSDKNPILHKVASAGLVGTGHGAPFPAVDGSWKYVFHAHWSKTSVQPRVSYFLDFAISDDGVASIGGKLIKPRVIK